MFLFGYHYNNIINHILKINKMENLTENNKLIAEFMELNSEPYYLPQHGLIECKYGEFDRNENFYADELKFHSDWNWLMEVVEKIELKKETFCFEIKKNFVFIHLDNGKAELIKHFTCKESKIKSVYGAVVEFIKWYNLNKS